MIFSHDRQIKGYFLFVCGYAILVLAAAIWFCQVQASIVKTMYLGHDAAVVSSLLEQGVTKEVIVTAIANTAKSTEGNALLNSIGIDEEAISSLIPPLSYFQARTITLIFCLCSPFILVLFTGTVLFFRKRNQLYRKAQNIVERYIHNDYSLHLSENNEGEIYRLFASIDQLATMMRSKNEAEHSTKDFLKNTISDISHQLKTPLAALTLYQEIIETEPDNVVTVKEFSNRIAVTINRMEQLIQSLLKITRLDAGSIVFDKKRYPVNDIIQNAVSELTMRAINENKQIIISGNPNHTLLCDRNWTSEAIENLTKNALDHTEAGGIIRITWENAPTMLRISISDNGDGISQEDIYHIFKRYYRSKHSLDTQGTGLGLPLAKSIVEGQNGFISVQSSLHEGTTFTISFLTRS